jgi:hypothetical protein
VTEQPKLTTEQQRKTKTTQREKTKTRRKQQTVPRNAFVVQQPKIVRKILFVRAKYWLGGMDLGLTKENMNDLHLFCEEFGFSAVLTKFRLSFWRPR